MRREDAEWFLAAVDDHAEAADDAVLAQQRGRLEALLAIEVLYDHRLAVHHGVVGLRPLDAGLVGLPAGARAQLVHAVLAQLEQLAVAYAERRRGDAHALLQQRVESGGRGERLLPEARDRLLLLLAHRQFDLDLLARDDRAERRQRRHQAIELRLVDGRRLGAVEHDDGDHFGAREHRQPDGGVEAGLQREALAGETLLGHGADVGEPDRFRLRHTLPGRPPPGRKPSRRLAMRKFV